MRVTEVPPRDARPLIAEIHAGLLALLASLRDAEWAAPTEAGRWTVKDVALVRRTGRAVLRHRGPDRPGPRELGQRRHGARVAGPGQGDDRAVGPPAAHQGRDRPARRP